VLNGQSRRTWIAPVIPPPAPVALHALRQLADMVYQGPWAEYAALPDVVLTHFREDYGSALKRRLAPLPRPERLRTLIEELSRTPVLRGETDHDIQLAANEGDAAGRLAAARLEQRAASPDEYPHTGFTAMFRVLRGLGDRRYEPLVRRFKDQPLPLNCTSAIYYDIRDGIRSAPMSAY
jgi:hypothetical protein